MLGAVASAPVVDVLALALDDSDNALTETVARQAAVSAGPAGQLRRRRPAFVDAGRRSLGVDTRRRARLDASGLSRGTRDPARVLADVLALAAGRPDPALQAGGRAAAGRRAVSGTLPTGSTARPPRRGRLARAKTGTLPVSARWPAPWSTRDGRLLTFVVMADRIPRRRRNARAPGPRWTGSWRRSRPAGAADAVEP